MNRIDPWQDFESDLNRQKTLEAIRGFQKSNGAIYTMYQKQDEWRYAQGDATAIISGVQHTTVVYPNYQENQ